MPGTNGTAPPQQLRRLMEANRLAVEHLELPLVLRQIIEAAVELAGSAYGAVGVLGGNGHLDEFVHTGMDAETVLRIGPTPDGRGLLGALIDDPRTVRLGSMGEDGRSVGVPEHHPPIASFLGVPLRVREEVFGHLYLADPRVDAFSEEDQTLVEALAVTAGVAIAHARMFEESTRREQWTAATSEITHELLTSDDVDALQLVADRVRELAGADQVTVVLTHGARAPYDELRVDRTSGDTAAGLVGVRLAPGDTLPRRCLRTRRPQLAESLDADPYPAGTTPAAAPGPAMAVPLVDREGVKGVILVLRGTGGRQFAEFDLDVAASLAGHAALALDRADARAAKASVRQREDRDRIARDLHDHAIQRLFAVGLNLHRVEGSIGAGPDADRLGAQVDEIDATIRQIRTTIFALGTPGTAPAGLRAVVLDVVSGAAAVLLEAPEVVFSGPIDLLVPASLHADVSAVVREALSNVARHASASRVAVRVTATPAQLRVVVEDDGRGPGEDRVLSGLENLRQRATARGGSLELAARRGPGSRLCWTVPLDEPVPD